MTQILITIPDGAPGDTATVMTLISGDYSIPASAMDKWSLHRCIDATREATRYFQETLRDKK